MSEEFNVKASVSEIFCPLKNNRIHCNSINDNYDTHEVFRNDTTAVEVIVKQVKNKNIQAQNTIGEKNVTRLYQEIEHLRNELNKTNKNLDEAKKGFELVLFEMGRQLQAANQRELKSQTQNLVLQLEKEKLSSILESKTNLVAKLRKELLGMRRIIKLVNKGIRSVPRFNASEETGSEYTAFVNKLKESPKQCEAGDENATNESTISSKI
ncbi:unnamed protein product [Euphydryas editha]|uniref:Uncharacterized protein n=1 Tax=Euphydryas editha TaxID=104508 RepID=A0AAU9U9B4_EUPED|nr:unnamed protein product [Euphydryas editha]